MAQRFSFAQYLFIWVFCMNRIDGRHSYL